METLTADEYNALMGKQKQSKYRNKKVEVDGIIFDSMKEAQRYRELKLMEQAGRIYNLEVQPKFPMVVNGVKVCTYVADFRYLDGGDPVVEDVKSPATKTRVYSIKRKLMLAVYGITIVEVM